MTLHLSRMRRNVNRKVYNDRKNVSATTYSVLHSTACGESVLVEHIQMDQGSEKRDWRLAHGASEKIHLQRRKISVIVQSHLFIVTNTNIYSR